MRETWKWNKTRSSASRIFVNQEFLFFKYSSSGEITEYVKTNIMCPNSICLLVGSPRFHQPFSSSITRPARWYHDTVLSCNLNIIAKFLDDITIRSACNSYSLISLHSLLHTGQSNKSVLNTRYAISRSRRINSEQSDQGLYFSIWSEK